MKHYAFDLLALEDMLADQIQWNYFSKYLSLKATVMFYDFDYLISSASSEKKSLTDLGVRLFDCIEKVRGFLSLSISAIWHKGGGGPPQKRVSRYFLFLFLSATWQEGEAHYRKRKSWPPGSGMQALFSHIFLSLPRGRWKEPQKRTSCIFLSLPCGRRRGTSKKGLVICTYFVR